MRPVRGKPAIFLPMELSSDSVVVTTPRMVAADLGEEVIVLHLENGLYFGLGNVGARIWKLLQKPVRVGEIERLLLDEYEVDPDTCHREVLSLISHMLDEKLIEVSEP